MKKKLFISVLCFLMLISVSGCRQAPAQGKPGGEAPAVISVWYTLAGGNETQLLKQFDRINKLCPEVIIRGQKMPEAGFVEKVWNLQAGGEGPEIMIAPRPIILALYAKGAISPVLADSDQTYPAALAVYTFNQQPFAAPWLADVPLLYYRKDKVQPPATMNNLITAPNTVACGTFDFSLFSPWWKAEGGILSLNESPALDAQSNLAFANKIISLKSEGRILFDNQALEKFKTGEVNYYLGWSSDSTGFDKSGVPWGCASLSSLLGPNGKALLDRSLGIANSAVKTVPELEDAIRLVEAELLKTETETPMRQVSGYMPLSSAYYSNGEATSYNEQVRITLENAFYAEGYQLDWKLLNLADQAWKNIAAGANIETELAKEQQSALDSVKK